MDNNKEKKDKKVPLDESPVPHVHKGVAIMAISLFMAILLLPSAVWGGLMVANMYDSSVLAKYNPQTSEHLAAKEYAKFPTKFDPETIAAEIEAWYNDHLPFRSIIFNANEDMMSQLEKPFEEDLRPIFITMFNKNNNNQQNPSLDNSDNEEIFTDRHQGVETEPIEETETETLPPDITEETETKPTFEDDTQPEEEESVPEYPDDGDYFNPAARPGDGCDHDFVGEIKVEPTCGEYGVMLYTCSKCGGEKPEYIAKTGEHDFVDAVLQEPTCAEWGIKGKQCTVCKAVKNRESIDKLAHTLEDVVIEASCTENGFTGQKCSVCDKMVSGKYSAKLGHSFPETSVLCGMNYKGAACVNCGALEFEGTKVAMHVAGKRLSVVEPTVATYGYTLIECKNCGGQYRTNIKNRLSDGSIFEPYYRSATVLEGKYRWLFYLGDNSAAYYNGANLLSDAELADYLNTLKTLDELCKAQGKTLQISVWPNKDQIYPEFTGIPDVGYKNKRVYQWMEYVRANSDVKLVYPVEELVAAKPYLDVYCMYDTHWNTAGGFIGYQKMLESLGLETMNVLDCPVYEYTGGAAFAPDHYYTQLRGDMMGMGGWSFNAGDYPPHRNYYIKYRPEVEFKFVDGTDGKNGASDIRHTKAENATYDVNFVMLSDSFRVMQLGYLEKDFSDCYLCHRSQVNDAKTKAAIKDADIISICSVERNEANIIATAKQIINILSSN